MGAILLFNCFCAVALPVSLVAVLADVADRIRRVRG